MNVVIILLSLKFLLFNCVADKVTDFIPIKAVEISESSNVKILDLELEILLEDEIKLPENFVITLTESDIEALPYIAKVVDGECGSGTLTEQAAVIWCILNRVDSDIRYIPDDIISVITQEGQFAGYDAARPVREDLLALGWDVLLRWRLEKIGIENVGRILPKDYCWFHGDGYYNYYRNTFEGNNTIWDWSLKSPYNN